MGAVTKLVDVLLFVFFLVIALAAPLLDAQTCLPVDLFPEAFVDLKLWYGRDYGDHLVAEKPNFIVGLVWLELLFPWPVSIVNLYGLLAGKSWFRTACLVYGVSAFTSMVAVLSELMESDKASDKLLIMYSLFMGFAV